MYLKTLRMRGFKSFPQSVELRFEDAIAVIVGPNGSGKSNIADALQWAMATQAPAQLRAPTSQDVLFGGSDGRPPAGVCEVELVLDNSCGTLDVEFNEVSVMRRLYRDGESEYLLNRARVRRLDVLELLSDTGLGREMHSIIGQGRVEEILLSKPHERRRFVEEAAGLGKYQRRRVRAEAKLARVASELERARDLETAVRARLRPLQMQATAADRAARLGGEITVARLALIESELAAERVRLDGARGRLEAAVAVRNEAEAALERLAARRDGAEQELAGLAAAQERAAHAFYAFDAARLRAAEQGDRLRRAVDGLRRACDRRSAAAARLAAEAVALEAEAAAATAEAGRARTAHDRLAAAGGGGLEQAATAADAALAEALAAHRALAEVEGEAEYLGGRRRQAADRVDELELLLSALSVEAGTVATQLAEVRSARAGADATAAAAGAERERSQEASRSAAGALAEVAEQARIARSDAHRSAQEAALLRARVDGLGRLIERGEGLAPAARAAEAAGAALVLAGVRPHQGYERAVTAALGWRAGGVVADRLAAAVELVSRAEGELSVVVAGSARRGGELPPAPSARPLNELVEVDDPAVAHLIDGVWLVDDLAAVRHGVAVTVEGTGVDADRGELWRVAGAGETTLLAAGAEHRRATAELAEAEVGARDAEQRAAERERVAAEHETAAAAARAALDQAARAAEQAESGLRTSAAAEHALSDRLARADAARDVAGRDLDEERGRVAALETGAAACAERLFERRAEADRADSVHTQLERTRRELAEQAARRAAELAGLAERVRRHDEDAVRLRRQAAAARAAAAAASELGERAAGELNGADRAIAAVSGLAGAAEALRLPARAGVEAIEQRAAVLADQLRVCAQEEAEGQTSARTAAQGATELEVARARCEERIDELERRRGELLGPAGDDAPEPADEPLEPDDAAALAARIERLERRRESLGAVNPLAAQEYEAERARVDELGEQCTDLERALAELRTLIGDLTRTIDTRFAETFARVASGFSEVVETLFPGGSGRLVLTEDVVAAPVAGAVVAGDPEAEPVDVRPSEPGIELEVKPAGKRSLSLSLLSGGEKSLTAIAFLFALLLTRPSPFYVLDEVEAALDDANIERFLGLLRAFQGRAQFIVITHQRRTMEVADILYGVSMAADGESKVLSRRMPEAEPAAAG